MRWVYAGLPIAVLACLMFLATDGLTQQVTVSTPFQSLSDSFFENMGTSWGLSGRNWHASFGGSPIQAAPSFGGFDPNAGANLGFNWRSGGAGGFFNGNFSQGNRRSFVTQVPSVTLQNGVPGYISDSSYTPFVMSYVPVVGGFPMVGTYNPVPPFAPSMVPSPGGSGVGRDAVVNALERARAERAQKERMQEEALADAEAARMNPPARPNAQNRHGNDDLVLIGAALPAAQAAESASDGPARKLAAARASSAGRPVPSVAEARRLHAAEQAGEKSEALAYLERGRNAEAIGKPNVAKVYYQMAARRASGNLRDQILARLNALETP